MTLGERIRAIRTESGLNLRQFAQRIGITQSAASTLENNKNGISNQTITFMCREFGVNEEWLRTGEGEMYAPLTREEELGRLVRRFFSARPESFQRALITALLRFDPDGPEWVIVERIARSVVEEWQQAQQSAQQDARQESDVDDGGL